MVGYSVDIERYPVVIKRRRLPISRAVHGALVHFWVSPLLATGTLQGKLIRAERRGLLLAYANSVGGILAIGAAALLMYQWLGSETPRYSAVFGATAVCFGLAAIASLYFREPPSLPQQPQTFFKFLGAGLLLLRSDRDFRKFAVVAVLFFSSWPLFPHYTVFG